MSSENLVAVISAAFSILAFAMVAIDQWNYGKDAENAKREISRFPLFAVRANLVRLVAEGKIKEEDPAWQSIYQRVNFFLRMDQSLTLLDLVRRYARSQIEAENNPELRDRVQKAIQVERERAESIPEYGRIAEETRNALMHLVRMRTTWLQRYTVLFLSVVLSIIAAALSGGMSMAKAVSRSRAVAKPSSENLLTWQTAENIRAVA